MIELRPQAWSHLSVRAILEAQKMYSYLISEACTVEHQMIWHHMDGVVALELNV